MSTLIISDKPNCTRALLRNLPADLDADDTYVSHMSRTGPARMQLTRGRPLSDYPLIEEPRYVLEASPRFDAMPIKAYTDSRTYGSAKATSVPDLLPAVTRLVYAVDLDHAAVWAFRSALTLWAGNAAGEADYEAWLFTDLADLTIRKAIAAGTTTKELANLYDYGRTKRYFEFQWANNANVVFGAAMRSVSPGAGRIPSKFGMQLLYALRERCLGSEARIIDHMYHWPGTGKYPSSRMGSEASRCEIVSQLREMGLISKGEWAAISTRGEAFLAALHPDCEDRDLPQRLDAWCKAGFGASQAAIDRYIRTVFGKQLRFASKGEPA